jgi:putative PIN family toxin of toxin-antitoxin system
MKPQAVYDTNVVVSGTLTPDRIPASLISFAIQGTVQLYLSPALLTEYTEVLKRPVFGFTSHAVDTFLDELVNAAVMVYPKTRVTSALDEPDNRILECALEAKAQYIVTGNKRHFPFAEFEGIKIVSPAEFATFLVEQH